MSRIFIDITSEESHWNGVTGMRVLERDDLSGTDMAIAFGDHQIVLTTSQAVTLYEMLDAFVNGGPVRTTGEITKRVRQAVNIITEECWSEFQRLWTDTYTRDHFARQFAEMVKMQGLRFRVTDEEPMR